MHQRSRSPVSPWIFQFTSPKMLRSFHDPWAKQQSWTSKGPQLQGGMFPLQEIVRGVPYWRIMKPSIPFNSPWNNHQQPPTIPYVTTPFPCCISPSSPKKCHLEPYLKTWILLNFELPGFPIKTRVDRQPPKVITLSLDLFLRCFC